jgi:mycofactocin precursor
MSVTSAEPVVELATEPPAPAEAPRDEVLAELLVEEISIDGMCGVY